MHQDTITADELRGIVSAWGGAEKFARVLGVSLRLVSYWLAGKRRVTPATARLIRRLTSQQQPQGGAKP